MSKIKVLLKKSYDIELDNEDIKSAVKSMDLNKYIPTRITMWDKSLFKISKIEVKDNTLSIDIVVNKIDLSKFKLQSEYKFNDIGYDDLFVSIKFKQGKIGSGDGFIDDGESRYGDVFFDFSRFMAYDIMENIISICKSEMVC